jgi:aminotransferase
MLSVRSTQLPGGGITDAVRGLAAGPLVDLALGAPDWPVPGELRDAAVAAMLAGPHPYSSSRGTPRLRQAIAERTQRHIGVAIDPDSQLTVTCGATEAISVVMLAIADPGDEVILFEPFYQSYLPALALAGARPRYVTLRPPDWSIDLDELAAAFTRRTRAIVVNTPANPTGKVFTRAELSAIADLCSARGVVCVSDEVYDGMVFDGARHHSMLELDAMRQHSVAINSLSKTYSAPGWRLGYVIAPPLISQAVRRVHEAVTCCASTPLQDAAVAALELPAAYYEQMRDDLQARRDRLVGALVQHGIECYPPRGAFYLLASRGRVGLPYTRDFATLLAQEAGVATVPGSCFYARPTHGKDLVRFCFARSDDTLRAAEGRLARLGLEVLT